MRLTDVNLHGVLLDMFYIDTIIEASPHIATGITDQWIAWYTYVKIYTCLLGSMIEHKIYLFLLRVYKSII